MEIFPYSLIPRIPNPRQRDEDTALAYLGTFFLCRSGGSLKVRDPKSFGSLRCESGRFEVIIAFNPGYPGFIVGIPFSAT